jgi:hypothetical protein
MAMPRESRLFLDRLIQPSPAGESVALYSERPPGGSVWQGWVTSGLREFGLDRAGGSWYKGAGWRNTEAAMTRKPLEPFDVLCPCCQAKLRIDPELRAVLSHEPAPEERSVKDLTEAVKGLNAEAARRQARFEESMKAEKGKKDLLDRKFQEALKKAKDEPITKPTRDIDLD